jgi:hypothetical protein
MSSHRASLDEERAQPLLYTNAPAPAATTSYLRVFFVAFLAVALVAGVVVGVVFAMDRGGSGSNASDEDELADPLDDSPLDADAGNTTDKILKPSCEKLAKKMFKKHDTLTAFKYPSDKPQHKDVYCVPNDYVRFTQDTVSSTSSSGHTLEWWIKKMQDAGYFAKSNLPDMVHWRSDYYQSIDNRRIYCAKKAGIVWIPAHVHEFDEPLPADQVNRFPLTITSRYYSGTKHAPTWGAAAIFRSVTEQTVDFPIFGRLDLPTVIYYNTTTPTNSTTPAAPAGPTTAAIEVY